MHRHSKKREGGDNNRKCHHELHIFRTFLSGGEND